MWHTLDTCLVGISFVEVVFASQGALKFLRIVRLAKMVRLFRLIRLLRFFRSLRLLIYAIAKTLRALLWTMLLLTIILYSFSIMFTQAATTHIIDLGIPQSADPQSDVEKYYGTMLRSCYTLFMSITGGVNWGVVVDILADVGSQWVFLFMCYICFTYFAVLNVVTGFFCQTAIESATQDAQAVLMAQQAAKAEYVKRLKNLFAKIDQDNLGKITLGSFQLSLKDDQVQAFFASMDLTVIDAWEFFKLLDQSGDHIIAIEEFVEGCLHLRGTAGKMDVASLRYEVKFLMQSFQHLMSHVQSNGTGRERCHTKDTNVDSIY